MTESRPDGLGRYRLLASAVAGRALEVAAADIGESTWTDGSTVFVNPQAAYGDRLVSVVVQAALLGAGSFDATVMASLSKRPALTRRYLAVEGHRALGVHEHLLPIPVRRLLDRGTANRTNSPPESLAIARSDAALRDPPDVFGAIRPKSVAVTHLGVDHRSAVHQQLPRAGGSQSLNELRDDDSGPVIDLISSPVGGGGAIGKLLKRLFGDARSERGGPPGAGTPSHWSLRRAPTAGIMAISTRTAQVTRDALPDAASGITYPEWDCNRRRYKPKWCTVFEVEPIPDPAVAGPTADSHALRRALARLGVELERHHRQLQGDDIDIDAAVEAQMQLRAGIAPDDAVYIDSLRCKRDLSVVLLLDVSGSAGEPSVTGVPVHEHQRTAAGALTMALHELGDRVAVYGFRSQGRTAVHLLPVKRLADDLDALVFQRLGGLVPVAYTRLGAAIRHGTAVLAQQGGTVRRLLIVLSDGFAYDHGYEQAYGEADARRALSEARRRGIGCLCLSIGARTNADALRRVFGTAAHAAVARGEHLQAIVGPLFQAALRSAEVQHRAFVRRERTRARLDIERRSA